MEENSNQEFEGNEFMFIYEWVDSVNLSRPKKNIARDFSDGGTLNFKSHITKNPLIKIIF